MFRISNIRGAVVASTVALVVSGCGGTSTAPKGWTPPAADYYKTLSDTDATTSTIGGVGIKSGNGAYEVVTGSGSLNHNTGSFSYDDGSYSVVDPDGKSVGGQYSDGQGGTINTINYAYSGTYEYVMPLTVNYRVNNVDYVTQGFGGIITDVIHVPVNGTADYTGEATGFAVAGSSGLFELLGISTISVDFASGLVDVELGGFTATDDKANPTTSPFDTVVITGMTIAGNTFTGGDLVTLLADVPISVIGTSISSNSEGAFFGWDYDGVIPDEVAGVSVTEGSDGMLLFSFVGD